MKDDLLDFGSDMSRSAGDIGKGLSYAANMAGDFAERTGNLFTEGHFASDTEIESYNRIQESIANGTALQEGTLEYYELMAKLDPDSMTSEDIRNLYYARADAQSEVKPELVMAAYPEAESMQVFREIEHKMSENSNGLISPIKGFSKEDILENTDKDPQVIGEPRIGDRFGPRNGKSHYGIDFKGAGGETLVSTETGEVTYSGSDEDIWGYNAVVKSPEGLETVYAHMTEESYKKGQEMYKDNNSIDQGDYVGVVGDSGKYWDSKTKEQKDYFTHLHFAMRVQSNDLDKFVNKYNLNIKNDVLPRNNYYYINPEKLLRGR